MTLFKGSASLTLLPRILANAREMRIPSCNDRSFQLGQYIEMPDIKKPLVQEITLFVPVMEECMRTDPRYPGYDILYTTFLVPYTY